MTELRTLPPFEQVEDDVNLVLAIASLHYLYGKFEVALNIVSFAEHLSPNNISVLELKVILLTELQFYEEVLIICNCNAFRSSKISGEIVSCRERAYRSLH